MEVPEPCRAAPEEPRRGGPREAPEHARIAAILAGGRATRRPASRAAWLAAVIVGSICAIGFVLLLALDGEPGRAGGDHAPPHASSRGAGCAGGLGLGLGLGIAIGFLLARRQSADHSSRNRP